MRLSILDNGHRLRARLFLGATSKMSRVDSPDIVKMLVYRPDFLTRTLLDLSATAMRGESYWTAGEREYLAMRTAQRHRCPFCADTHAELTRIAAAGEIDPDDTASARPELTAVLDFLDALSDGAADPGRLRGRGVPDRAIMEALRVRVVWNVVNRLANAFGYELREGQLHSGTRALHRFGYRFPGFLLAGGARTVDRGDLVENLRHAVLDGPGHTDPADRKAAATGDSLTEPWSSYTLKVRASSYRVTDADMETLAAAGHTQDEIFEMTVAAAVGVALTEYDAGQRALTRSPDT
ncbi:hypothetical protein ALI144C_06665 [Actinosynnema sp. ALI-1.44]|uniref:hypothetical protein n=1 Tax=Actinosynnema sp. ALI-1.44 TaxID=1933779 RepID=UPI00097CA000|nr:hypothetical protein [Actinosynnema sp. ALI-1.44]ONI88696.1 hypothetical protein ALI144C_06665 [Actinosynnema sp. ALI-1.44]